MTADFNIDSVPPSWTINLRRLRQQKRRKRWEDFKSHIRLPRPSESLMLAVFAAVSLSLSTALIVIILS